jgi:hypothetical protein
MKQIMVTTAVMALAFSFPSFTAAQTQANGPSSAAAEKGSEAKVNTDNSTKTIDVTKTVDITKKKIDLDLTKTVDSNNLKTKTTTNTNSGDSKASGAFGASANNASTASSTLDLKLTNAFNKTTVVNATKLDGYVSGNNIHDIGNTGGYATNSGTTGAGGDGGNTKAVAYSGKAVTNGGDGGYSKAGSGGDGGKSSIDQDVKNGYARNSEMGKGKAHQIAKTEAEARAKGADGGKGGSGGDGAAGGAGGAAGAATSGNATVKRTIGGHGGDGGDLRVRGGNAGTFDASNTIGGSSFSNAGGIIAPIQNTGMSSLQQVGVSVMATINGSSRAAMP